MFLQLEGRYVSQADHEVLHAVARRVPPISYD